MGRRIISAASFLVVCWMVCSLFLDKATADWEYTAYGRQTKDVLLNDFTLAISPLTAITVQYIDPDRMKYITWKTTMETEKDLMPGRCESDKAALNTFGWNKFRQDMVASVRTDRVLALGNIRLSITFRKTPMLSILESETIKCALTLDGDPYYDPEATKIDPPYFSFTIRKAGIQATLEMEGIHKNPDTKAAITVYEKNIRRHGFLLIFTLITDIWLVDRKADIIKGFQSPQNALNIILKEQDLNISEAEPNILKVAIPKERTADFNVDPGSLNEISFHPSEKMTLKGLLPDARAEDLRFPVIAEDVSPDIIIQNRPDGIFRISEACVRGKEPNCQRDMTLNIIGREGKPSGTNFLFEPDAVKAGFSGSAQFQLFQAGFVKEVRLTSGDRAFEIEIEANDKFEIWQNETVDYTFPVLAIENMEPPVLSNPLKLLISPSQGSLRGNFFDLDEDELWRGGQVMNFLMDGESWVEDEARLEIIGITTVDANNDFGWKRFRHQIVPQSAISFPISTTLQLTFQQVFDFDINVPEVVTFHVKHTMIRSGIPIPSSAITANTFRIKPVKGILLFEGNSTFEEEALWTQNLTLRLKLAGESWVDGTKFDACISDMLTGASAKSWTSDRTSDKGWTLKANRQKMLAGKITRVDRRTIEIPLRAIPEYDILRRETITVTAPASCTETNIVPGETKLVIEPHPAVFSVRFFSQRGTEVTGEASWTSSKTVTGADGNQTTVETTTLFPGISETRLRQGGELVVEVQYDTFDNSNPSQLQQNVFNALRSKYGVESTGWNAKRSVILTSASKIHVGDPTKIVITLNSDPRFDISRDEWIDFVVDKNWLISRRDPVRSPIFIVYVAPGLVMIPYWFGADRKRVVTEDDVRQGILYFNFTLLGDQWRQERSHYVSSLALTDYSQPYAIHANRENVLPDVEFFSFAFREGYDIVVVRFQAAPTYDIHKDEQITFRWSGGVVLSKVPPFFSYMNGSNEVTSSSWSFPVRATPGQLVMSGVVREVNEKMFRRGGIKIFLALFGETFSSQAPQLLYDALVSRDDTPTGFNALKSSILLLSNINTTDYTATIEFVLNRRFDINEADILSLILTPDLFSSRMVPTVKSALQIPIAKTGGELSFSLYNISGTSIDEETMAIQGLRVYLQLDGDTWRHRALKIRPISFLTGFTSSSSIISEPRGLAGNYIPILQLLAPNVTVMNDSFVEVFFCGYCSDVHYDISADEIISFSLQDPLYVMTSILPEPSVISFKVTVKSRIIVMDIDVAALGEANSPLWQPENRFSLERLISVMEFLLSTPKRRLIVSENREEGVVVKMSFRPPLTAADGATVTEVADTRTSTELSELFMALNRTFIFQHVFAKTLYYEDEGKPATPGPTILKPSDLGGFGLAPQSDLMKGTMGTIIWLCIAVVFFGIIGIVMLCNSWARRASMPGHMRSSTNPAEHRRKFGHMVSGQPYDVAEDGTIMSLDPMKLYSGQKKNPYQNKPMNNPLTDDIEIRSLKEVARENIMQEKQRLIDQERLGLPTRRMAVKAHTPNYVLRDGDMDDTEGHHLSTPSISSRTAYAPGRPQHSVISSVATTRRTNTNPLETMKK